MTYKRGWRTYKLETLLQTQMTQASKAHGQAVALSCQKEQHYHTLHALIHLKQGRLELYEELRKDTLGLANQPLLHTL